MKVKVLFSILLISFLSLSCVQNPDQMLEAFNDNLLEDIGGGMFQRGDVIINPELIERDVYSVNPGGTLRLEISAAYYYYTWTLSDNSSGRKWNVPGYYIVYVGRPDIELEAGHKYTLTLNLKNRNGVKYTDSAIINVVKK